MTKRRRWHRIVIPFFLVFALIGGTVVVRWLTEPDASDPQYLSPTVAGDTSARNLAELVRGKGVTVRRETSTPAALTALWSMNGKATLFIPAPRYVNSAYLWMLRQSPTGTRVVLVEPGDGELFQAIPLISISSKRWATAITGPGGKCPLTTAGQAAITRTRYAQWPNPKEPRAGTYCYDSGLVSLSFSGVEFVLAGSADPFRDDRMPQHDNAKLATDLLSARPTLIWLDLHDTEPYPKSYTEKTPPAGGTPLPSLAPGKEIDRPDASPTPSRSYSPRPKATSSKRPGPQVAIEPPSPFPDWLLPLFLILILAAFAVVMARGRRLGAPLTEPLPVEVRGAETAIGRSRLYRRAHARGPALDTLRLEARRRIALALGLPAQAPADQLLDRLTARLGEPREKLADVLFGPSPQDDDELETRTTELLLLVEQVTRNGKETPS